MSNLINTIAIYAIFNRAYGVAADLHAAMQEQGIGDRTTARPFAVEWAGKVHGEKPYMGKRGITLKHGGVAYEAMEYVLSVIYPNPGTTGKKKSGSVKPVTKGAKFLGKVKAAKRGGLKYSTALAMLNEAYGM